jgi:hypothetical protein
LSAEVRRANQLLKPSERYTLREIERRVKVFLADWAFDKPHMPRSMMCADENRIAKTRRPQGDYGK